MARYRKSEPPRGLSDDELLRWWQAETSRQVKEREERSRGRNRPPKRGAPIEEWVEYYRATGQLAHFAQPVADCTIAESKVSRWKFSFAESTLTEDERMVAWTLRSGLKCCATRRDDVARAKVDVEQKLAKSGWDWQTEYNDAMAEIVRMTREYRDHGMPSRWPRCLPNFWYWVAVRQNMEG